jgi:hypothetical protein
MTFFIYEVFGEVMVKFHQELVLYRNVRSVRNAVLATDRVSNCRNSQIANRFEPLDGPSES